MIKRYTLFLDESETHKHNEMTHKDCDYHFCMAGVVVAEDEYAQLQRSVNQLKRNIWPELSNPEDVILHQIRLLEAEKGRLDIGKYPEYAKFNRRAERKKLYGELKKVFADNKLTIVGSSINEDNLKQYYWVTIKVTMFRKVSNTQEKVSNATKNMCNTLKEVSNAAGKVINNAQKVSNTFEKYMPLFREAEITDKFIKNIEQVFCACGTGVPFGQANVQEWLSCSKSKATNVMNAMKAAKVINKVTGFGSGRYEFIEL